MDDEFSDLFLMNDCLISSRLSPGPPDDFLGQNGGGGGSSTFADGIMLNGHHNGEMAANFLCFDGGESEMMGFSTTTTTSAAAAASPPILHMSSLIHRRSSSSASTYAALISGAPRSTSSTSTTATDRFVNNGHGGLFTYVKTESSAASSLSSPSGRSPDHDYTSDVKMEGTAPVLNGTSNGYGNDGGGDGICTSNGKTASSVLEYCRGAIDEDIDDSRPINKYDVDADYYVDTIEDGIAPIRNGLDTNGRIVGGSTSSSLINGLTITSSSGASSSSSVSVGIKPITSGDHRRYQHSSSVITIGDADMDNLGARSDTMDGDAWTSCDDPVLLRGGGGEDDAVPSGDDNSSTTSGDSCSNCGYLSSGSPAPPGQKNGNHQHQTTGAHHHHHQSKGGNLRYHRASNASANANLNLRTRSKMHELALKHNLISEQDPRNKGYVLLSTEERRTLMQEGLPVPTKLPMTKQEEEALKIVRRKIKNKLSAQESRRKRKEYMETLEQQIEGYQSENSSLRRRIDVLEKSNQSLIGQLKKLQQQVNTPTSNALPTTTMALVAGQRNSSSDDSSSTSTTQHRGASSNVHSVSLAAVFLLFAVMIPAMPIWPSVFRNAFITNSLTTEAPSGIPAYDHSRNEMLFAPSRVLRSSGNGDCDIPYSAEYFEKLNECWNGDDPNDENEPKSSPASNDETNPATTTLIYSAVVNFTEKSARTSDDEENPLSSTAVCDSTCREAIGAAHTIATA